MAIATDHSLPPPAPSRTAGLTVALAGNPNSGKTTIFNALTGLRQKVANYPGITVERKTGRCRLDSGDWIEVVDLPGTYSLVASSPDEQVTTEVLRGLRSDTAPPDAVVVVVDASNLPRNLYLVSQLLELGKPLVVALNMMDIAERRSLGVDAKALAQQLGVAVVPIVGHKRRGIDQLKAAIIAARPPPVPEWPLPEAMWEELRRLDHELGTLPDSAVTDARAAQTTPVGIACRILVGDEAGLTALADRHRARFTAAIGRLTALSIDPVQADIEARYRWIDTVVAKVARAPQSGDAGARTFTDRLDAVLVHRVAGLAIFALIMAALFISIFWLAKPIMDGLQSAIAALSDLVTGRMGEGALKSLLADGVFKGVGAVVVFVPQIALLFLFLAVLEDSGYLARAAFLMDKLLAKVGLHGKSFIPLLSSFACAIPGIMATRTIDSRKERLATILVAPFMSCSARLPVYGLMIDLFFRQHGALVEGGVMLACYLLGIAAAAGTAWCCKIFLGRAEVTPFILEMPSYKFPQASEVGRQVWTNTAKFLTKAGTTIFCLSVVLWALAYYPRLPDQRAATIRQEAATRYDAQTVAPEPAPTPAAVPATAAAEPVPTPEQQRGEALDRAVAGAQREYSAAGRIGHLIEPLVSPLGFDWKIGVGLVGAFAAREVFVSTMGIVYSLGEVEEAPDRNRLEQAMLADRHADGRPVWTPLVAVSLLVWFVLAMQCMSTVAIVRRETGGWGWPLFQLAFMNLLAYVAALAVYQVGLRIWG